MIFARPWIVVWTAIALSPAPAAADDAGVCRLYADLGIAGIEYMRELPPDQLLGLMTGADEKVLNGMAAAMAEAADQARTEILAQPGIDWRALGGAASRNAFSLMLSGQTESLDDTREVIFESCVEDGPQTIIAEYYASRPENQ